MVADHRARNDKIGIKLGGTQVEVVVVLKKEIVHFKAL
jgi:hypothetical protein